MKFRKLLMAVAFFIAIGSTFAFKNYAKKGPVVYYSYFLGGTCYLAHDTQDQEYCDASFTGPQCTHAGTPIYFYSLTPPGAPTCTVPLRRPF